MAEQQGTAAPDAVMTRIGQVVMLHHGGDREEARSRFLDLWAEIGEDGDPLHRCTLAHYMADAQDDPADELAWDLRALAAAEELTDGRVAEHHRSLVMRAFYPSLHLNLAADYTRLGRAETARSHLRLARGAVDALADDAYGNGVRAAMDRLEHQLNGGGTTEEGTTGEGSSEPPGPGAPRPPRQHP
ncbi:hypothetical protein [Streptomyces poonensis]|uniref:Tetratricopeptide repeat protein n=1 Tax=Streptomyces poonensis TaxID=68255 RepID=A0A918QDN3_9ACTN|nr:hypothetical protein [Streptomyces poonensis]GGZ42199.1 hypothetical protein GCM10010365_73650 [Streptomyces poonensis]GLJ92731.1 hypothetical protein GCM10017589_53410 [Streptomyces poonensis]